MWKQRAVTLCGCLAALGVLMGCAGPGAPSQAYAPSPAYAPSAPIAAEAPDGGARVYAVGAGEPAAILVMLPGPRDMLTGDPRLWAAQGFDVVAPSPSEIYRIAADQQATAARLLAQARAMAGAPIWLVGADPAVTAAMAAMPPTGAGQVAGVVVTSTSSGSGTCSERMIYAYSGNGGPPQVAVSKSGNACPAGSPFGTATNPAAAPPVPTGQPKGPHLIEASAGATARPAARRTVIERVADLIKSAPPS